MEHDRLVVIQIDWWCIYHLDDICNHLYTILIVDSVWIGGFGGAEVPHRHPLGAYRTTTAHKGWEMERSVQSHCRWFVIPKRGMWHPGLSGALRHETSLCHFDGSSQFKPAAFGPDSTTHKGQHAASDFFTCREQDGNVPRFVVLFRAVFWGASYS